MKRVLQQDASGCGLACVAMLANASYAQVKDEALKLPHFTLEDTYHTQGIDLRILLNRFHIQCGKRLVRFSEWNRLPDCCVLAVNYNERYQMWHWVLFLRVGPDSYVLDPRKTILSSKRRDFGRMKPFWYLKIEQKP